MMVLIPADPTLIGVVMGDFPQGEVRVSWRGGDLWVDHADPRVMITLKLLDDLVCGRGGPQVTVALDTLHASPGSWIGAVVRIEAVNRALIYRLTEYLDWYRGYIAEWPD